MDRQSAYEIVEEAIKACDRALKKSFYAMPQGYSGSCHFPYVKVIREEEMEKIKNILKKSQ